MSEDKSTRFHFFIRKQDRELWEIIHSFPPGEASDKIRQAVIETYGHKSGEAVQVAGMDEILKRLDELIQLAKQPKGGDNEKSE